MQHSFFVGRDDHKILLDQERPGSLLFFTLSTPEDANGGTSITVGLYPSEVRMMARSLLNMIGELSEGE